MFLIQELYWGEKMKKKILIVEDSQAEQLLIAGLLKGLGVEIALADTGYEALGWLVNHGQPDLIVLDIVMPDISGLDLCRQIRNQLHFENVPIIFCSQKNQDFDRFWALRQGGNAYVIKPYSPIDLLKTVKEYL
jgi:twitching motility two-component system response regulator PilH